MPVHIADGQNRIDNAEKLLVLLDILETRAKQTDFDYSATQLLASWLGEGLAALPELAEVAQALRGLSSSVEIVTGRGQSEIWSLFRTDRPRLSDDLRTAISRVSDPSECPSWVGRDSADAQSCGTQYCKPWRPTEPKTPTLKRSCRRCWLICKRRGFRVAGGSIGTCWLESSLMPWMHGAVT